MFLGLDIGTSAVKAVILREGGDMAAHAASPLTVQRPHDGWSEQDPMDWWRACEAAVSALDPRLRSRVRAIGLSGQMHGAILLDEGRQPLRPAILWNDGRSIAECATLEANCPQLREISGNAAMSGFTAPKLLWVRQHEPDLFARIDKVLLPKDFVRLQMTGELATDVSDAAGTMWLDTAARSWSDALLDACELSSLHMPRLYEGVEIAGVLRPEVAAGWGMQSVPVVAGGGDNAAGAAGLGAVREGEGVLSLGTSGTIFLPTGQFAPNPAGGVHAFCHCVPDMWHLMSVHLSAASCLDWLAGLFGSDVPELLARAERHGPAGDGELFLPYLSGERTPHNDPHIRAALIGLGHGSDAGKLAAAVLEGVAFALRDGLDALCATDARVDELMVAGGGARSLYWGGILAAALDRPLRYLDGSDTGPALGAARLAMAGTNDLSPAEIFTRPPTLRVIEPSRRLQERMHANMARFRRAYPAIKRI